MYVTALRVACVYTVLFASTTVYASEPVDVRAPPTTCSSEHGSDVWRVGVTVSDPMVMRGPEGYHGISIDLWEHVARRAQIAFCYVEQPTLDALFRSLGDETHILVGPLTATSNREARYGNFTLPYFNTGLRILAPLESQTTLWVVLASLLTTLTLSAVLVIVCFVALSTPMVYLLERNTNEHVHGTFFFEGMLDAMQLVVGFMTTWGDKRKNPEHRVTNLVFMPVGFLMGVLLASVLASQFIDSVSTERNKSSITSIYDLTGKTVAIKSSTAVQKALERRELGVTFQVTDTLRDAIMLVQSGEADAVVYDEALLQYELTRMDATKLALVGPLFERQGYGFVVTHDRRDVQEALNRALLELYENNTTHRIVGQYLNGL